MVTVLIFIVLVIVTSIVLTSPYHLWMWYRRRRDEKPIDKALGKTMKSLSDWSKTTTDAIAKTKQMGEELEKSAQAIKKPTTKFADACPHCGSGNIIIDDGKMKCNWCKVEMEFKVTIETDGEGSSQIKTTKKSAKPTPGIPYPDPEFGMYKEALQKETPPLALQVNDKGSYAFKPIKLHSDKEYLKMKMEMHKKWSTGIISTKDYVKCMEGEKLAIDTEGDAAYAYVEKVKKAMGYISMGKGNVPTETIDGEAIFIPANPDAVVKKTELKCVKCGCDGVFVGKKKLKGSAFCLACGYEMNHDPTYKQEYPASFSKNPAGEIPLEEPKKCSLKPPPHCPVCGSAYITTFGKPPKCIDCGREMTYEEMTEPLLVGDIGAKKQELNVAVANYGAAMTAASKANESEKVLANITEDYTDAINILKAELAVLQNKLLAEHPEGINMITNKDVNIVVEKSLPPVKNPHRFLDI